MGWFHDLGKKVSGEVHSIGKKIHNAGQRAAKIVHKVAPKIASIAKEVSDDAGLVGDVAAAALPFVSEIPGAGLVVGGLAAGAEAVSGIASGVESGAELAESATRGIERVSAGAKKDVKAVGRGILDTAAARGRAGESLTSADLKGEVRKGAVSSMNRFVGHNIITNP
jgi:hypothetical protein